MSPVLRRFSEAKERKMGEEEGKRGSGSRYIICSWEMPFTNSQYDVPVGHWAYTYRLDLCSLSWFPRIRCSQHIAVYALQKICSRRKRTSEDPSRSPTKYSR